MEWTLPGTAYSAIGFGFSMFNADIVLGYVFDNGSFVIRDYFARKEGPPQLDTDFGGTDDVHPISGKRENGATTLKFGRLLKTGDPYDNDISSHLVNMMYTWNPGTPGVISFHGSNGGLLFVDLSDQSGYVRMTTDPFGPFQMAWSFIPELSMIEIQYQLPGSGYTALGFGTSMTDADIIVSYANDSVHSIQDRWSFKHGTPSLDTKLNGTNDVVPVLAVYDPRWKKTVSQFRRKLNTGDRFDIELKKGKTNVIYAWVDGVAGVVTYHRQNRKATQVTLVDKNTFISKVSPLQLSWVFVEDNAITFEIRLPGTSFIALGFGISMFNSDVIAGWVTNNSFTIGDYWSDGHKPPQLDTDLGGTNDVTPISGRIENGVTILQFKRNLVTPDKFDNPISTNLVNIIYAWNSKPGSQGFSYHGRTQRFHELIDLSKPDGIPNLYKNPVGPFQLAWSWLPDSRSVEMEFRLPGSDFVAIGFGTSMQDSDMIIGWSSNYNISTISDKNQTFNVDDYYSSARAPPKTDVVLGGRDDVIPIAGSWQNNSVAVGTTLQFRRRLNTTDRFDKVIINGPMDVIYAWGSGKGAGNIHFHGPNHNAVSVDLSKPDGGGTTNSSSCSFNNNYIQLTWNFVGDSIQIQFTLPGTQFIGLGLGATTMMETDMVIGWVFPNGTFFVGDYYSKSESVPSLDISLPGCKNDLTLVSGSYVDGQTTISFQRKLDTGDRCDTPIDRSRTNFVCAWQSGGPTGDLSTGHGDNHRTFAVELGDCSPTAERFPAESLIWIAISLSLLILIMVSYILNTFGFRFPPLTSPQFKMNWKFLRHLYFSLFLLLLALVIFGAYKISDLDETFGFKWIPTLHISLFYSYLVLAFFSLFLYTFKPGGFIHILHKQIIINRTVFLTVGECLALLIYIGFNLRWGFYWYDLSTVVYVTKTDHLARLVGHMNELNIALLLLPVTRSSPWLYFFGIPFERAIKYHRWIGRVVFVLVTIHLGLWWGFWGDRGVLRECAFHFNCAQKGVLVGELAWLFSLIMVIFAYEWVRRNYFEVFYFVHHLFIGFFILSIYHSWLVGGNLLSYILFGLAFYFFDRVIRFVRGRLLKARFMDIHREISEVTHLRINKPGFSFFPGQYVFVCIPQISWLEWHPLSISCSPDDTGDFTLHVKEMGRNSWTNKLALLARQVGSDKSRYPTVMIDGPYGNPGIALEDYPELLLVAGGIGITPIISILEYIWLDCDVEGTGSRSSRSFRQLSPAARCFNLSKIEKVTLVWVVKEPFCLAWFGDLLKKIRNDGNQRLSRVSFHLLLHVTTSKASKVGMEHIKHSSSDPLLQDETISNPSPSPIDLPAYNIGRPNFDQVLDQLVNSFDTNSEINVTPSDPHRVGVFVCGPVNMMDDCKVACSRVPASHVKFDVHEESFYF